VSGPHEPVSQLLPLDLEGPAGRIEGLLQERAGSEPGFVALVCHPHPLYGGTLHNKVTHRVASAFHGLGAAVLRFNFRGVGKSEGAYDQGAGELDDARAAWAYMRERWPGARRWLAGFSFGSWIAARLGAELRDVERLLLVAPPIHRNDFSALRRATVDKRVIQGTADDVCTPGLLQAEWPYWAEPKRLVMVEGAGHFFDRKLDALAAAVGELFGDVAAVAAEGSSEPAPPPNPGP
jgi:alpha/beta superfamily hydrolase